MLAILTWIAYQAGKPVLPAVGGLEKDLRDEVQDIWARWEATALEIEYGLVRLSSSKRKKRLQERFAVFLDELPRAEWTDDVSRAFGEAKARLERRGLRLEDFDLAVAAHALAAGATLVTDDLEHMSRIPGLQLENWRQSPKA